MEIENKHILIGGLLLIGGYLAYKKFSKNAIEQESEGMVIDSDEGSDDKFRMPVKDPNKASVGTSINIDCNQIVKNAIREKSIDYEGVLRLLRIDNKHVTELSESEMNRVCSHVRFVSIYATRVPESQQK